MSSAISMAAPRGFARQSVIQTGAAAVLLGAALLATSGARAADVERDDNHCETGRAGACGSRRSASSAGPSRRISAAIG